MQQQQYYQYLQSEIDKINIRDAENKKRAELEKVIPVEPFLNRETVEFNEQRFQNELDKRVKSNLSVDEIAELYDVKISYNNNNTGKTASTSSNNINKSPWFLDVFELQNVRQ